MTRARFAVTPLPGGGTRLRLTVAGHAGYAPPGQDILCAAASILAESLAQVLQSRDGSGGITACCRRGDGRMELTADCAPGQYPQVRAWFEPTLAGYRLLAQHYPRWVRFYPQKEAESC